MAAPAIDLHALDLASAGVTDRMVQVESANPRNFHAAISDPGSCPPVAIEARLAVRPGAPTVIIVPGSAGVGPNHVEHARTLIAAGYSVCLVDPFGGRAVTSTVANQAQYSFAASAFDVVATLRTIADLPGIDPERVSAQGHSRGGAAVAAAACRQFADVIGGPGLALAGAYLAYPWCGQQFTPPRVGRTRVRAIIGDRDDWGSVVQAQGLIHAMAGTGAVATIRLVAGAGHSFDRDEAFHEIPEARVSPHAPTEYLAEDGSMIDPYTGSPDPARTDLEQFRAAVANGFGQRGAHMGSSHPEQPALFRADMLAFHAATFA